MSKNLLTVMMMFTALCYLSSCRIFKKGSRKKVKADTTAVINIPDTTVFVATPLPTPAINPEKQQLIATLMPLWDKQIDFKTFTGKAKMHYEGKGEKHEFTAIIRMKKDQGIWVSVTALGGIVQVARVLVTPDSFKLINYLNKEYMVMSVSEAGRVLPAAVDFQVLQNLIIGNVLKHSGIPSDATEFGGSQMLEMQEADYIQQVTYNKADNTMRSLQVKSVAPGGFEGLIQYGGYGQVEGRTFPANRSVRIVNEGEQHLVDMDYNNASFDKDIDLPFSIPKGYDRK
jgi:hypothetical protein